MMLVRLIPRFPNTPRQSASAPGDSCEDTVKVTRVLYARASTGDSTKVRRSSERVLASGRRTRKRVVLVCESWIEGARTDRLDCVAASEEEIAAAVGSEGLAATRAAPREVEETSCFSACLRWAARKALHWPQACGWE